MVYEVFAHVETKKSVDSFLYVIRKFGKCFYALDYDRCKDDDLNELHILRVTAVAISRDLIYKLRWKMNCSRKPVTRKEWVSKKKPWYGLYPDASDEVATMFYPDMSEEDPIYNNIFDKHGFVYVDDMQKIE